MVIAHKKVQSLEKKSTNFIADEMSRYLNTLQSDYFLFDPREPSEDAILHYFNGIRNLGDRKKFRRAIYEIIIDTGFIVLENNIIFSLLNLIEYMRINDVAEILIDLVLKKEFLGKGRKTTSEIKNRIIFLLAKKIHPPISQKVLREIIENNIDNNACASTCLSATFKLRPRIDSFIELFPRAIKTFKNDENLIEIAYVFYNFLILIGKTNIYKRFQDIFFIKDQEIITVIGEILDFLSGRLIPFDLGLDLEEGNTEIQVKIPTFPKKNFTRVVDGFDVDPNGQLWDFLIRHNPDYEGFGIGDDGKEKVSNETK